MTDTDATTYEAGYDACLKTMRAQPVTALHCTKDGQADKYVPADQLTWHTDHHWTCTPMIYRPRGV